MGKSNICPLCGNKMISLDDNDEEKFPIINSIYYKNYMFFKILILMSVIVVTVSLIINILYQSDIYWSLLVLLGIGCGWITLILLILKRNNIHKSLLWQIISITILSIIWDKLTGWHGWSINYVIPIVCSVFMIIMVLAAKILKPQRGDYIIYILFDCVFGMVQLILIILKVVNIVIPSLICVVFSIISLTSLILFEGKNILEELKCRLHL